MANGMNPKGLSGRPLGPALRIAFFFIQARGAVVVGGISTLGAGLYSIGTPKDSIVKYKTAFKSDKFLVIAHGTSD